MEAGVRDMCATAMADGSLPRLIAATSSFETSPTAPRNSHEFALMACSIVESGRFDLAVKFLSEYRSTSVSDSALVDRLESIISRRIFRKSSGAKLGGLADATNAWLDGKLLTALTTVGLLLLRHPQDREALFLKALVLWEQGYLLDALDDVAMLKRSVKAPISAAEIEVLDNLLGLDLRFLDLSEPAQLLNLKGIPEISTEAYQMVEYFQLQLAWRQNHIGSVQELLKRLRYHPRIRPYKLALGMQHQGKKSENQSVREKVSAYVALAVQSDHKSGLRQLAVAIEIAEPHGLMSPFLEFGRREPALVTEAFSNATSSFFCERGIALLCMPRPKREPQLTDRELLVLRLFSSGLTGPEIAESLGVSLETVKSHSHHAIQKLGVRRRSEAIELLKVRGLIPQVVRRHLATLKGSG